MEAEEKQMWKKGVWEEVDRPAHMDTYLDTQYVIVEKYDSNGNYVKTKGSNPSNGSGQIHNCTHMSTGS